MKDNPDGNIEITCNNDRGLHGGKFKDVEGNHCSIQNSSLARHAALWLGVDTPADHPDADYTRMHLHGPLVRRVLHQLKNLQTKGKASSIKFTDLYGSQCEIRMDTAKAGVVRVGVVVPFNHPKTTQVTMAIDNFLASQLIPVMERFLTTGSVADLVYKFHPGQFGFKPLSSFPGLEEYLGTDSFVKVSARSDFSYWYLSCRKTAVLSDDDRWTFSQGVYTPPDKEHPRPVQNGLVSTVYQGCVTSPEFARDLLIHLLGTLTNEGTLKYGAERLAAEI